MKWQILTILLELGKSPSMRREWIEIYTMLESMWHLIVSLHAEGVD